MLDKDKDICHVTLVKTKYKNDVMKLLKFQHFLKTFIQVETP